MQGSPVLGSNVMVETRLLDPATEVKLILRDLNGALLAEVPMSKLDPSNNEEDYFAEITMPTVAFKMSIAGLDDQGATFEEVPKGDGSFPGTSSTPISPAKVSLSILPSALIVNRGENMKLKVKIPETSVTGKYAIRMKSSSGKIIPSIRTVKISSNKAAEVSFVYKAPKTAEPFQPVILTAILFDKKNIKKEINKGSIKIHVSQ
jgi:hypothetical protein